MKYPYEISSNTLEKAEENAEEALRLHVAGLLIDSKEFGWHLDTLPTPSIAINIEV